MGAFFLIASAFVFLAAALFLRLRTAWLCLPLWLALCWYLPSGSILHSLVPPEDTGTEIVVTRRPMPSFFAFSFMFMCVVVVIIWRTAALANFSLRDQQPRRWSHRFLQAVLCLICCGALCLFALAFTSMTNQYLLTAAGTDGTVFPRAGYLFYFVCTGIVCAAVIRQMRAKNHALAATAFPAALILVICSASAILSHTDITARAEKIAAGKPYCLTMGMGSKAPYPFAFAEMPDILSLMHSGWPPGPVARLVEKQDGGGDTEIAIMRDGHHPLPKTAVRVISCIPEAHYALKPWPRPPVDTIDVYTAQAQYKIPATVASVKYPFENGMGKQPLASIILRTPEHSFTITVPAADAKTAANEVVQFSDAYSAHETMTFHHAPFDYEMTIKKADRENATAIQQRLIKQVESWRVDDAPAHTK